MAHDIVISHYSGKKRKTDSESDEEEKSEGHDDDGGNSNVDDKKMALVKMNEESGSSENLSRAKRGAGQPICSNRNYADLVLRLDCDYRLEFAQLGWQYTGRSVVGARSRFPMALWSARGGIPVVLKQMRDKESYKHELMMHILVTRLQIPHAARLLGAMPLAECLPSGRGDPATTGYYWALVLPVLQPLYDHEKDLPGSALPAAP
jgi:hypothetical protein